MLAANLETTAVARVRGSSGVVLGKPLTRSPPMKPINRSKFVTAVMLAALAAAPALSQDKKAAGQPNEAEMMAKMMELAKPGENHTFMQNNLVGTWTATVKMWMDPSLPPSVTTGKSVTKAVMGGRYFITEHTGKMEMPGPDGKPQAMDFNGMATDGYDNVKKKFVSTWIDNMGTMIVMMEGTYDKPSRTLTYTTEFEMMPGMKTKARQVVKFVNHIEHVMEWYEDRGGKEVKTMEITYKRET